MEYKQKTTIDFIKLMENEENSELVKKAIAKAQAINSDPITNPVHDLNSLYDFLEYSVTCMPWDVLKNPDFENLYFCVDQCIDYFWFLFSQHLEELEHHDYYRPTLEYHEPFASWIKEYSDAWGAFLNTEESWNDDYFAKSFIDDSFGMNKNWFPQENIYKTYNEFFSRHLIDASVRPIGNAELVAPADSRPDKVFPIDEVGFVKDDVKVKNHKVYNVNDILGADSKYRGCFNNGTITHTFLDVNDYHRYHFPIDGKIVEMSKIKGASAAGGETIYIPQEKRYYLNCGDTSWQIKQTRDCIVLDTAVGLVAILPIGMSQINSCNFEENLKVGDTVKKGDPLGYFLFGGSDIVMLFNKDIDFTLLATPYEHILMGEDYASLKLK